MTVPLILQIQAAALDSRASLSDALRKAKLACSKLNLTEFQEWIDLELNGYTDKAVAEMPKYRIVYGRAEGFNPYHGWQPIQFETTEQQENWGSAPINMTIPSIEQSLKDTKSDGCFSYYFSAEMAALLNSALAVKDIQLRIKVGIYQISDILNSVRNILLEWSLSMEKQGILGTDLMFSSDEQKKSEAVTAQAINNFHINQVGSLVQHAENSIVQGGIESTMISPQKTLDLIANAHALLPLANLEPHIHDKTVSALDELQQAATASKPDNGRLRKGLESLKRIFASAGETALKAVVDSLVSGLLSQ